MIRRYPELCRRISTHALREEGDQFGSNCATPILPFLPTPSARRATPRPEDNAEPMVISTHALREEGD